MAISYEIFNIVFKDTIYFNITWLVSAIITFLTLATLSRDPQKWKELAFPVMVAWHIAGIPPFFLFYIASAIMFTVETLSLQTIGNLLSLIKIPKKTKTIFQKELDKAQRKQTKGEITKYIESKYSSTPLGVFSRKELKEIRRRGLGK